MAAATPPLVITRRIIPGAHTMTGVLYAPDASHYVREGADSVQRSVIGCQVNLGGPGLVDYDPTQLATVPPRQVALVQ